MVDSRAGSWLLWLSVCGSGVNISLGVCVRVCDSLVSWVLLVVSDDGVGDSSLALVQEHDRSLVKLSHVKPACRPLGLADSSLLLHPQSLRVQDFFVDFTKFCQSQSDFSTH